MSWLVTNTVLAAGMALVVLAVLRWWRPRPAIAHVLWALVLLRLLGPPVWELPLSWPSTSPAVVELTPAQLVATLTAAPADPVVAARSAAADGGWLLAIWLLGSGGLAIAIAGALARAAWRLRGAAAAPAWLRHEVDQLAKRLGVATPALVDTPAARSPFVWSLLRPRLLLDSRTMAATDLAARTAVIAHELAHLRRRDHWLAWLELFGAVALWWHPLFWFARARMREQAELACDAWALWAAPDARLGYADALISSLHEDQPAAIPLVLAARPGERRAFERRLSMILNDSVPCRLSRWSLLPVAVLTLGAFCSPVLAQEGERPRVEIRINGKDISELSPRERQRLLHELGDQGVHLRGLLGPADEAQEPEAPKPKAKTKAKAGKSKKPAVAVGGGDGEDLGAGIRAAMQEGLAEAKAEIAADEDLAELGIQDDVLALLDAIGSGNGVDLGESVNGLVGKALKGAAKMAKKEIAADADLQRLGLADSVAGLIDSLAENDELLEGLGGLIQSTMAAAADEAMAEIAADEDLARLGIADDVQGLVGALLKGEGDFEASLEQVIGKAMKAAMQEAEGGMKAALSEGDEDLPAKKPARKGDKKAGKDKKKSTIR